MVKATICLFDVDGTLTKPRCAITEDILQFILGLNSKLPVALVSGSDYSKLMDQMGGPTSNLTFVYFCFYSIEKHSIYIFGKWISSAQIWTIRKQYCRIFMKRLLFAYCRALLSMLEKN